jgi:hypothetical protein
MRTVRTPNTSDWKPFQPAGLPTSLPSVNYREIPTRAAMPAPAVPQPPVTDVPNRDMDEHWTALTAYLADMDFPNEG